MSGTIPLRVEALTLLLVATTEGAAEDRETW